MFRTKHAQKVGYIQFLKVVKCSKRMNKEVDAKHLLFFMWWVDCEAVLTLV